MTASDWIALIQGAFLAVAAVFAWRTYRLGRIENGRTPRRRLLGDAIDELKALALESETYLPGVGIKRLDLITGHQRRLAIALAFIPWAAAVDTWKLTKCPAQDVSKDGIEGAAAELNYALRALDRGLLDDDAYLSPGGGDRPPIRPPKNLAARLRRLLPSRHPFGRE